MSDSKKQYIGIDLGTTNTLVSYVKGNKRKMIKFDGMEVLPSVLYVDTMNNGSVYVGSKAAASGKTDPTNKIASSKTYIGTDKKYEFTMADGSVMTLTPTDAAAYILKTVKAKVIERLRLDEDDEIHAVITVPAAFSFAQNEATMEAAKIAGINVLGIRPEPIAAAASCMDNIDLSDGKANVFVVDIGGGTYDTAVISIDDSFVPEMISAEGDRRLGGDDFDKLIYEHFKYEFQDESGIDLDSVEASGLDPSEYYRLKSNLLDCAQEAKTELTISEKVKVLRNDMYLLNGEPQEYETILTRDEFNTICAPLYDDILRRLEGSIKSFQKKGLAISDITHLVLVGGTCYIPAVIELITKKIGLNPMLVTDKTTAVAEGAAKIASEWTTLGASLGGIISQSMGVRVENGQFSKIICKGESYPCKNTRKYTTVRDYQEKIEVFIYAAAPDKENVSNITFHEYYGHFTLDNIQKEKAGKPNIDVTFEFDSSQRLTVTARDCITGSTNQVVINKDEAMPDCDTGAPCAIDLLIDVSGSMDGPKLTDAKNACDRMINSIVDLSVNSMGITAFNDKQTNICPITQDKDELLTSVRTMKAKYGTYMGKGILYSTEKLINTSYDDKIIIMMTDGAPNNGDESEYIAKEIRSRYNIRLAVIFIGQKMSRGHAYARNVAEANTLEGEKPLFYHSNNMADLSEIFKAVYADIKLLK